MRTIEYLGATLETDEVGGVFYLTIDGREVRKTFPRPELAIDYGRRRVKARHRRDQRGTAVAETTSLYGLPVAAIDARHRERWAVAVAEHGDRLPHSLEMKLLEQLAGDHRERIGLRRTDGKPIAPRPEGV